MDNRLKAIQLVHKVKPMTPEAVKEAESYGMIPKSKLKDGRFYKGACRNAFIAMWDLRQNVFIHLRTKCGDTFAEKIPHPEDDRGFDVFVPLEEIEDFKF